MQEEGCCGQSVLIDMAPVVDNAEATIAKMKIMVAALTPRNCTARFSLGSWMCGGLLPCDRDAF